MKLLQILVPVAVSLAAANPVEDLGTHWTTVFAAEYTTYCPSPTTFVFSDVTYTATEEATVTITNCPCTISVLQPAPNTTTKFCTDETDYTGTGWIAPSASVSDPWMNPTLGDPITVVTYAPPATTYISGNPVVIVTYTPPAVTHISGTTPVTYTAPAITRISGTTPVTSSQHTIFASATVSYSGDPPSETPTRASTSRPVAVPTAAAVHVGPAPAVCLIAAGLAVMAL